MLTDFFYDDTVYEDGVDHVDYVDEANVQDDVHLRFFNDVEVLARTSIENYFQNKEFYCGGPIPSDLLYNAETVTLVLNTNMLSGVERAYAAIEESGCYNTYGENGKVAEDIRTVITLIHEIEREVFRPFVAGILLMHLELVEGIEI